MVRPPGFWPLTSKDHDARRDVIEGAREIGLLGNDRCARIGLRDALVDLPNGLGIAIDRVDRSRLADQLGQRPAEIARAGTQISPHAARPGHAAANQRHHFGLIHSICSHDLRGGGAGAACRPRNAFFGWYGRQSRLYQPKRKYLGGPLALQTSQQSADCVSPVNNGTYAVGALRITIYTLPRLDNHVTA